MARDAWADQRSDLFSPASSSIASGVLPTLFMRKFQDRYILGAGSNLLSELQSPSKFQIVFDLYHHPTEFIEYPHQFLDL